MDVNEAGVPEIYLKDRVILLCLYYDYCCAGDSVGFNIIVDYKWDEEETEFCINIINEDIIYETQYGIIALCWGNAKTVSLTYGKEKRKIDFMCKHNIRYCDYYHKSKRVLEDIMSRQPEITDIPDLYNQAISVTSCTKNARKQ